VSPLIGIINAIHSLVVVSDCIIRDLIILALLCLPLLVNRKMFFLFFGLLAALLSILIFMVHLINFPDQNLFSISMYVTGFFLYALSFCCGSAMMYIGTYSGEKNSFRLI